MNEHELLMDVLQQDEDAVAFCESVFKISQVLDDLIDGDAVSPEAIIEAFWRTIFLLPHNEFYQKNFSFLNSLLQVALIDWLTANELEHGTQQDKLVAFTLRDSVVLIAIHSAFLIGGFEWGRKAAVDLRRHVHDEPFENYCGGLTHG